MKFEVKTQSDELSKSSFSVFLVFAIILSTTILSIIAIKIGTISRHYEINYFCNLLTIEKQSSNFKKLSKLTNQTSKQKMWDLCREIVR